MRFDRAKMLLVALAIAGLAVAGTAHAITVDYTVLGWGQQFPGLVTPPANAPWGVNGYPGDTVELQTYTGTLDLTPGTSTQKINTLLWTIDYTYGGTATDPDAWSDVLFSFAGLRDMSIDGGPLGTLNQAGSLEATWENDFLSFSSGSAITFNVQGYRVDVTPEAVARVGGSDFPGGPTGNPWIQPPRDVMARFDVSLAEVPEPTTLVLGGMLLAIFGASRLRSNRRKHEE